MSWYPPTKLSKKQYKYLKLLQKIWKVRDAEGDWVEYKLEPHQIEFHSNDAAVMGQDAKSDVVVKSRNTSFTTSASIRNLMAVPHYPKQIVPFIRLNITRAQDLLEEVKDYIRHMTPVKLENGQLYPFDPSLVEMDKVGSIKFPNGVEFRAMPANAQSAETIRGMRIRGSVGVVDESNFMKDFKKIYIALRDAARGSKKGKKHFQMTIGTTRKGMMTPFNIWFEDIEKKNIKTIRILRWPVFDPKIFDKDKPPIEQPQLTPIVWWHDINDLNDKFEEDLKVFLEEYMAVLTPDDTNFYNIVKIMELTDNELKNYEMPPHEGIYYMGVDPSGEGTDYFSVSIFEELEDGSLIQRKLFYNQKVGDDLDLMETYIGKLINVWSIKKARIDANMLGYQLGQSLKKRFGNVVELIRGRVNIKVRRDFSVSINEFMHTNLKKLISQKRIKFIDDEIQYRHFASWDYSFKAEHTREYGHGDTTISNALACLPLHWRSGEQDNSIKAVREKEIKITEKKSWNEVSVEDRIKYYKKQKKQLLI